MAIAEQDLFLRLADNAERERDILREQRQAQSRGMELAEEAEILRGSLREFIRAAWHVLEPATPFVPNWHIDCVSELQEAAYRRELLRLLVNVPPRHMKSLIVSVFAPAWRWTQKPEERFLMFSYADDLVRRDARKMRELVTSPWYQARFGDMVQLKRDQHQQGRFENQRQGYRISTSIGGGGTGEGGDVIVVDDPLKGEEAWSENARAKVLNWWSATQSSRLNDLSTGLKIVIMQRLHEGDLSGHILSGNRTDEGVPDPDEWVHVCLPAEYEPAHPFVCPREIVLPSGRKLTAEPRSEEGELLWPAKVSKSQLDAMDMTAMDRAGQLQQRPAPAEGGLFKRDHLRYWKPTQIDGVYNLGAGRIVEASKCWRMITCDLATTTKTSSDYTVVGTWDISPAAEMIALRIRRERLEGPEVKQLIRTEASIARPSMIGIEAVGYQVSVVQELRREGLPIVELHPDKDKFARAITAAAKLEAQQVYFEEEADYLGWFLPELLTFPNAIHDDGVDMFAYAAIEANRRGYDWDQAYGICRCASCGHGYVLTPPNRPCPECGTVQPQS